MFEEIHLSELAMSPSSEGGRKNNVSCDSFSQYDTYARQLIHSQRKGGLCLVVLHSGQQLGSFVAMGSRILCSSTYMLRA